MRDRQSCREERYCTIRFGRNLIYYDISAKSFERYPRQECAELWKPGQALDAQECELPMRPVLRPYHEALKRMLDQARRSHGTALLLYTHSIRSLVSLVSSVPLPGACLGSNKYARAGLKMVGPIANVVRAHGLECSIDEHSLGGCVTGNAGDPKNDIHAIWMETAKRVYLDESDQRAEPARMHVLLDLYSAVFEALATFKPIFPTSVNEGTNL
ncbi:N-formylglutamate amidohydrolase [Rhizobiales bacterium]|uniref:N-formylglutamate amidohydrolase n=1 Tax=Hongsoonwoonella zoysiae TaxID=2821844 RepID=UPI00155FDBD3|nr:N-formylglutamate amidohydrolase [Hongsoonwoonella zoysiae]NRG18990.1 N-formylglutamate amidohydrolase [Hongsoonwoonella zoysiae]